MTSAKRTVVAVTAGVALIAVGAAAVTRATAGARGTAILAPRTLHLVEEGGGLEVVDNPPKARHRFDFSPGDIVVVTRSVVEPDGRHAGSLRLVCVTTTATTQQCTGSETLAGGTLELAGVSSPSATTTAAVIGGTGRYHSVRGTSRSRDRKANPAIADQIISLHD